MHVLRQYVPFSCNGKRVVRCQKAFLAQAIHLFPSAIYLQSYAAYLSAQDMYLPAEEIYLSSQEKSVPALEKYFLAQVIYLSPEEINLATREKYLRGTAIYLLQLKKYLLAVERSGANATQASKWHGNTPYLSSNGGSLTHNGPMVRGKKTCCRAPPCRDGPNRAQQNTVTDFQQLKQQIKNKYHGFI